MVYLQSTSNSIRPLSDLTSNSTRLSHSMFAILLEILLATYRTLTLRQDTPKSVQIVFNHLRLGCLRALKLLLQ